MDKKIEKLLRFTISRWSSLNEKNEPDHQSLIQNWLEDECSDFMKENGIDNIEEANEYISQSYVSDSKGLPAMLLGDVKELVRILTNKDIKI